MRAKTVTAALSAVVVALMLAVPAQAAGPLSVESFSVGSSNTEAGAHPDVTTSISMNNPGEPEAAQDVAINFPEGVFGNPQAIAVCRSADFALNQCPGASQVGIITIRRELRRRSELPARDRADLRPGGPRELETARFAFVAPTADIPINVPIAVRTGSDYGLRMTVSGITQEIPFAGADITVWGFPADPEHDVDRFHAGRRAAAPVLPAPAASCLQYVTAGIPVKPFIDNPTVLHRAAADRKPRGDQLQEPEQPLAGAGELSADDQLRETDLQPRAQPGADEHRVGCPRPASTCSSGIRSSWDRPIRRPSFDRRRSRCPRADDQPRRRRRPDRLHRRAGELRQRGPGRLSRQLEDRHLRRSAPRPSTARSTARSTSANRSRATSTACS